MDNFTFLNRAILSKGSRYPALEGIYRKNKHLYATDGRRVHYCNGQDDCEGYIDGVDRGEFPDLSLVLQNAKDLYFISSFAASPAQVKALKKFAKLSPSSHVVLSIKDNQLSLLCEADLKEKDKRQEKTFATAKAEFRCECKQVKHTLSVCVNLHYFIDAIQDNGFCYLYGDTETDPIRIEGITGFALIMPVIRVKD